ncbi:MAG: sigma-70 family RNA polymerase sigma factor [Bacteroidales bacterium]|nr:sigma-70 family RNA polymerase sigma factor [Bacteroidales bacterium]
MRETDISKNFDYFLWEKFKTGDKEALSRIYYTYYNPLYDYGIRIHNDPAFIKDCIQELFFDLINKLSTLGSTDSIKSYLMASFRRRVFVKLKKSKGINYLEDSYAPDAFEIEPSAETQMISEESKDIYTKKIQGMLSKLSSREREAIYLKFYKNLSYKEITEVMEVNYQSARKLIYRAIKSLREMKSTVFEDLQDL